jgi:mono/diheme cytochrome c family protein
VPSTGDPDALDILADTDVGGNRTGRRNRPGIVSPAATRESLDHPAHHRTLVPVVVLLLSLTGLLLVAGCGGDDDPGRATGDPELDLGRQVYDNRCQSCHGSRGQGGVGPALGDGAVVENVPDAADHRQIVVEGRNTMPAFGGSLSDEEIDAVVRYERDELG